MTKFLFKFDRWRVYWHSDGTFTYQFAGQIQDRHVLLQDLPYMLQAEAQTTCSERKLNIE